MSPTDGSQSSRRVIVGKGLRMDKTCIHGARGNRADPDNFILSLETDKPEALLRFVFYGYQDRFHNVSMAGDPVDIHIFFGIPLFGDFKTGLNLHCFSNPYAPDLGKFDRCRLS
jgi:hypothetical protein